MLGIVSSIEGLKQHVLLSVEAESNPPLSATGYRLHGQVRERVKAVQNTAVLSQRKTRDWGVRVKATSAKANRISAFIYRHIRGCLSVTLTLTATKSLVRPILEYAATVWEPINKRCHRVLRRSRGELPGVSCRTSAPPQVPLDMSLKPELQKLGNHRTVATALMMCKIISSLVDFQPQENTLEPHARPSGGQPRKLVGSHTRTSTF